MEFKIDCPDCGDSHCVHDGKQSGYARCPNCKATTRHFIGVVEEQVEITSVLDSRRQVRDPNLSKTQAKRRGVDIKEGYDWGRNSRKFNYRYQEVNHRTGRYRKFVVDVETGEALKDCDEPLTEHKT